MEQPKLSVEAKDCVCVMCALNELLCIVAILQATDSQVKMRQVEFLSYQMCSN